MPAKAFNWMKWNAFVAILTAASFVPISMFSLLSVLDNFGPFFQSLGLAAFGLVQGALIGFGQALAMRNSVVSVPGKPWVIASTLGAGALWVLGQIPGYFVKLDFSNIFVSIGTLIVGFALLAFFGLVQWRILKHRVRQAWRWIPITVLAWLVGLLIFILGGVLIRSVTNIIVTVLALTAFGTIAVVAVAGISGFGMGVLAKDAIANPKYGTILPNTPRVNAAKKKVASVSSKARAKAAPVVKKAASKAAPVVKKATSATKSTVKKVTKRTAR